MLSVPKVISKKLKDSNVEVRYYDYFTDLLVDSDGELRPEIFQDLVPMMGSDLPPFRMQCRLGHTEFLCAIYPDEFLIRVATPHLSRETILLNNAKDELAKDEDTTAFINHVEQIAILESEFFPSVLDVCKVLYDIKELDQVRDVNEKSIIDNINDKLKKQKTNFKKLFIEKVIILYSKNKVMKNAATSLFSHLADTDLLQNKDVVKLEIIEALKYMLEHTESFSTWFNCLLKIKYNILCKVPSGIIAAVMNHYFKTIAKSLIIESPTQFKNENAKFTLSSFSDKIGQDYVDELNGMIEKAKSGIVSVSITRLSSDKDIDEIVERFVKLKELASKNDVGIMIEGQRYSDRQLVFDLLNRLENFNNVGVTVQAYFKDSYRYLNQILELEKQKSHIKPLAIRIVKGRFWLDETTSRQSENSVCVTFKNQDETNTMFRTLVARLFKAEANVLVIVATHNLSDHAYVEKLKADLNSNVTVEHQAYNSFFESELKALEELGYKIRNFMPIGDTSDAVKYFCRILDDRYRLQEVNTNRARIESTSAVIDSKFHNITPIRMYELNPKYLDVAQAYEFAASSDVPNVSNTALDFFHDDEWKTLRLITRISMIDRLTALFISRRLSIAKTLGGINRENLLAVDQAIDFFNFYSIKSLEIENLRPLGPFIIYFNDYSKFGTVCGNIAAALLCGDTVLINSSLRLSNIAEMIRVFFIEAGFPEKCIGHVTTENQVVDDRFAGIVYEGKRADGIDLMKAFYNHLYEETLPTALVSLGNKNTYFVTATANYKRALQAIKGDHEITKLVVAQSFFDDAKDELKDHDMLIYQDLKEGVELVNDTKYGGIVNVYSQSKSEIMYIVNTVQAGNININREYNNMIVGVNPLGGIKISGRGRKVGGKFYLNHFIRKSSSITRERDVDEQRGSDYLFRKCTPMCGGENEIIERHGKVIRVLDYVLLNFESIFKGLHGSSKDDLERVSRWISDQYLPIRLTPQIGVEIKGIKSYSDFRMFGEYTILLSENRRPEFITFIHFIFALLSGSGVTILVRNDDSFKWWKRIIGVLEKFEISKVNCDLYFCTEAQVLGAFKDGTVSNLIVDGDLDFLKLAMNNLWGEYEKVARLKCIYSNLSHCDLFSSKDIEMMAKSFLWERSIAINHPKL